MGPVRRPARTRRRRTSTGGRHARSAVSVLSPVADTGVRIALALRAVGGLTTREIARAFLVSEDTMTRRITRAKKCIETSGEPFRMPVPEERADRLAAVLHVLYLVFTEGYSATAARTSSASTCPPKRSGSPASSVTCCRPMRKPRVYSH